MLCQNLIFFLTIKSGTGSFFNLLLSFCSVSVIIVSAGKTEVLHMNLLHMKYAVEIARTGSISKASEALFVAQPNLSRSVKELEADLGIAIFDRTSKGMFLTPKGETFISYAKKVLSQIDDLEKMCREGISSKTALFHFRSPRKLYFRRLRAFFKAPEHGSG